jgi:ABC-type iron transport system FetAB permease component
MEFLQPPDTDGTDLTWTNVAIGLAFIIFDVGISTVLRLGVGISLLVAALRCIGQLAVVATVLQSVFEHKNPWSVTGIVCKYYSRILAISD